jgi:hypothetical protein
MIEKNEDISTYVYSEDELTADEIASVNEYWNKVKLKNPKLVELLDKSTPEIKKSHTN